MLCTLSKMKRTPLLAGVISLWILYLLLFLYIWKHRSSDVSFQFKLMMNNTLSWKPDVYNYRLANTSYPRAKLSRQKKVILLWTSFWGAADWEVGLGSDPFLRLDCPVQNCEITHDRARLNQSHAVLFHVHQLDDVIPPFKSTNQRWVFFMLESPGWSTNLNYQRWDGMFNWTMTYRLDSDIQLYYGQVKKRRVPPAHNTTKRKHILSHKTRMVAWMVSNCHTSSQRDQYVRKLQQYIPVDVYGRCGNLTCTKDWAGDDRQCLDMVGRRYWFYLAFENSLCKDYVTEKFFKALTLDVVPVVRGSARYTQHAPRRWFINTKNFKSPKHLAEHLKYLRDHPWQYMRHLEGRERYNIRAFFGIRHLPSWCELCQKLNDPTEPPKVYNQISRWWSAKDCFRLQNFV